MILDLIATYAGYGLVASCVGAVLFCTYDLIRGWSK
jgi:hypothetical protein